ncbi:MAG: hypothetical protein HYY11_01715 [Candidatus Methylomirabilis oxyfera]|nr:hypothetical protein [Candidatus Methylomirabilis oxyfera]
MRRWFKTGAITAAALLLYVTAGVPAWAGSAPAAGARPAVSGEATKQTQSLTAQAQTIPTFFAEVTAAFTAPPTPPTGGLGDAVAASRDTFSITESIEFNAVLLESGLAGTTADLTLFVFDPRGQLVAGGFSFFGIQAPDDRTNFFVTVDAASLFARGRLNWVITISDAFGGFFVTGFHAIEIQ